MNSDIIAILSLIISIVGGLPYLIKAIKGKIKPERITWGLWTLISFLALISYRAEGGESSSFFILGDLIITGSIFLTSIFKGKGGHSQLDKICLSLALGGLIFWQINSNPIYQIIGVVAADMLALIPTIKSVLESPEDESSTAFFSAAIASLLGLISIGSWNLSLILYPLYLYSINLITAVVIVSAKQVKLRKE